MARYKTTVPGGAGGAGGELTTIYPWDAQRLIHTGLQKNNALDYLTQVRDHVDTVAGWSTPGGAAEDLVGEACHIVIQHDASNAAWIMATADVSAMHVDSMSGANWHTGVGNTAMMMGMTTNNDGVWKTPTTPGACYSGGTGDWTGLFSIGGFALAGAGNPGTVIALNDAPMLATSMEYVSNNIYPSVWGNMIVGGAVDANGRHFAAATHGVSSNDLSLDWYDDINSGSGGATGFLLNATYADTSHRKMFHIEAGAKVALNRQMLNSYTVIGAPANHRDRVDADGKAHFDHVPVYDATNRVGHLRQTLFGPQASDWQKLTESGTDTAWALGQSVVDDAMWLADFHDVLARAGTIA